MSRQKQTMHKISQGRPFCKVKRPDRDKSRWSKDKKGSVNQINSEDSRDSDYAFNIADGKQPMVLVNEGSVPNVAMIVDSGASCEKC